MLQIKYFFSYLAFSCSSTICLLEVFSFGWVFCFFLVFFPPSIEYLAVAKEVEKQQGEM